MKNITLLILSLIAIISMINAQNCTNCDGNNVINTSAFSSALGESNTSNGSSSFAAGKLNTCSGMYSVALGYGISTTGNSSFSAGLYNTISGHYAMGFGSYLQATQTRSFIIGTGFNYSTPMSNNIQNSLMIGFGSSKSTVFVSPAPGSDKTGKLGIGDVTNPLAKLHIKSDFTEEAVILLEPNTWNSDGWAELRLGTNFNAVRASYTYGLQFKTDKNYIFNSTNANVGIGVLTPHEKLEVSGNIKQSPGFYIETDKVQAAGENGLKLQDDSGLGPIVKNGGKLGINVPTQLMIWMLTVLFLPKVSGWMMEMLLMGSYFKPMLMVSPIGLTRCSLVLMIMTGCQVVVIFTDRQVW